MSNILKVFIVLNFILSVVFLATSATLLGKAENWKMKHDEVSKTKDAEIGDLNKKLNAAQALAAKETADRLEAVNKAENLTVELTAKSGDLVEKKRDYEKLNNNMTALQEDFRTQTQAFKQSQTDRERYEKRATSAEEKARAAITAKETAENDARRLEAKVAQCEEQIAGMERDFNEMRKDRDHQKNLVAIAQEQGYDVSKAIIAPALEAVVQNVNPEYKYVMLSVGRDDKVVKGLRFTVSRNGSYVGEVQVDYIYPKSCSASFKRDGKPGMSIQAGDTAATRQ